MSNEITFSRKPYTVTYKDMQGNLQKIKRRPPPLLHDMLPTDKVELTTSKNADWQAGNVYEVKHINTRHPNVLQIQDQEGVATFVDSHDLKLDERVNFQGKEVAELQSFNEYLLWP